MNFDAQKFQREGDEPYLSQVRIDSKFPTRVREAIARFDALGDEHGHTDLPEYEQAISLVLEQELKAFGERPQDYVARELLLNSSMNDRRNWKFRLVQKRSPAWLSISLSKTQCLRANAKLFTLCRVFDYLHRMHTLQMLRDSDRQYGLHLDRVARCATSFFQIDKRPLSRTKGIRGRHAAQVCRETSICPHCFARKASNIFCSLKTKAAIQLNKGIFVLINVTQEFDPLDNAVVTDWKRDAISQLVELARKMGATGGMWTFQLTPTKDCVASCSCGDVVYSGESLGARLAVLAYIPISSESLRG